MKFVNKRTSIYTQIQNFIIDGNKFNTEDDTMNNEENKGEWNGIPFPKKCDMELMTRICIIFGHDPANITRKMTQNVGNASSTYLDDIMKKQEKAICYWNDKINSMITH